MGFVQMPGPQELRFFHVSLAVGLTIPSTYLNGQALLANKSKKKKGSQMYGYVKKKQRPGELRSAYSMLRSKAGIDPDTTVIYGAQNIGHQISVLPDGRLVNISRASIIAEDTNFFERTIIRSFDNGETWEQTAKTIPSTTIGGYVAFDAELYYASGGAIQNTVRSAGSIPDIAVNRTNGFMYVVWQDVDPKGEFIGVFMAMSKDGGDTWSELITVGGGDLTPDGYLSYAQLPAVHVADDGTVGVLFFDDRNDVICPDLNLSNEEDPECFTGNR
ncbi:MAG: sialidase family protein [Desulfobacteraceae bacterium]|jgi:hypothetical protein